MAERIHFRQRKSTRAVADKKPPPEDIERAVVGLASMGFTKPDARRALGAVSTRHAGHTANVPVPDLMREAIKLLT